MKIQHPFFIVGFFGLIQNSAAFELPDGLDKIFNHVSSIIIGTMGLEKVLPVHDIVSFNLYTRDNNNAHNIKLGKVRDVTESHFNIDLPIKFLIHGWTDHKEREIIRNLKNAIIENMHVNVIVVDWKGWAAKLYPMAAEHALQVGHHVADFIKFLHDDIGVDLKNVHLIGHSLGGQISGKAGFLLDGKIGRITGLDVAGPLFEFIGSPREHVDFLDSKDAKFVDVIHTAAEIFGVAESIGHVDFYPNSGTVPQPGCSNWITAVSCSHVRAVEFFTESINSTTGFWATHCRNKFFGMCDDSYKILMGMWTPTTARKGDYHLKTNSEAPFALRMEEE